MTSAVVVVYEWRRTRARGRRRQYPLLYLLVIYDYSLWHDCRSSIAAAAAAVGVVLADL